MKNGEFVLGGVEATDQGRDHAVCISKNYIYDSNYTNAITFSKEAMDACCPPGFQHFYDGYYFHKRFKEGNPKIWICKTKNPLENKK